MAYAFKVTVKNSYGKYVKGLTVQVVHASCGAPTTKEILQAFKDQLGIDINTATPNTTFMVEKLR